MSSSLSSNNKTTALRAVGSLFDAATKPFERLRDALVPPGYTPSPLTAVDRAVGAVFAALAVLFACVNFAAIDPRVYDYWNIYFHADPNRVLLDMTDPLSEQWRTAVHPIFSILGFVPMRTIMSLGVAAWRAAEFLVVISAALTAALFYLAMRGLGLSLMAAITFGAAFLASATFIHWFAFVETYPFAALTLAFMLYVMNCRPAAPMWIWIIASTGTLAITITNWTLALAASFFRLRVSAFVRASVVAFLIVAAVSCLQKVTFPHSRLFFDLRTLNQERLSTQIYLQHHGLIPWTPVENIRSALITSAVVPPPEVQNAPTPAGIYTLVTNQYVPLLRTSPVGLLAVACWLFLLVVGIWGGFRDVKRRALAVPLIAYILFQLALASIYGEITFLYACNIFPAMLALAALGWFTPLRHAVVATAAMFTIFGGINNFIEFKTTIQLANGIAAQYAAESTQGKQQKDRSGAQNVTKPESVAPSIQR